MEIMQPRYFDYLEEHGSDLSAALGLGNLAKDINHWRSFGMEYPGDVLRGCRVTMEVALKELSKPLPYDRMSIVEIIEHAESKGVIDGPTAYKCNEIRRLGNDGSHGASFRAIDAKMSLELLDDFLRGCAESLGFIPASLKSGSRVAGTVFAVKSEAEIADVSDKAKIAANLEDSRRIEDKAQSAKARVEACDDSTESILREIQALIEQARERGLLDPEGKDEEFLTAHKTLISGLDRRVESLNAERRSAKTAFEAVSTEVHEILSEKDFIRRLLGEGSMATTEQHEVMAFPKGSSGVTNILQIAGGAGTGKTLCLLAKLISEVDDHGQRYLFDAKSALFVCYNRHMASYVRGILSGYDGSDDTVARIEVTHYDEYVNQLMRQSPKSGYDHLAGYAQDVKYPGYRYRLAYGYDGDYVWLLKTAQATVAARHPDRAKDYYLDPSDEDEFEWLKDELQWIEARFGSDADAASDYPEATRVGRGTRHRPNATVRGIILEIRSEFNRLLDEKGKYTIDQATKRLLGSSNLPSYDAIAIDEVQDFSLISIRLLLKLRRGDSSMVFMAGDENQKIYQRDFTWRELGQGLRGRTITLHENMRNTPAIKRFSDRLLGVECPHEVACDKVHVEEADDGRVVKLLRTLAALPQTTAIISGRAKHWQDALGQADIRVLWPKVGLDESGIYIVTDKEGKGLEFDNVVVDYTREVGGDEAEERRIRYVHFTRARRRLYIRYQGDPPDLLSKYYPDFVARHPDPVGRA